MDYQMPLCNGLKATVMIRRFLAEQAITMKQPYIVCLSCYTADGTRKKAIEAGMDYFQVKPIFKSGLQTVLMKA